MYRKIYLTALLAASFLVFVLMPLRAQHFLIENQHQLCCNIYSLSKPVWDNAGEQLLLTGKHNRGLFILNVNTKELRQIESQLKIKSKPVWLKNGEIAYLKGNQYGFIKTLKSNGSDAADTLLTIDTRQQKIKAITLGSNKSWEVTPEKGLFYNPVIAPNGKLAVIHLKSEMYLYATDGSGIIKPLGTGIASSWSPDSRYIFGFLDSSANGHYIDGSELFVLDVETAERQQLTNSPGIFEMWPAVSPDGKKVVFSDEKTGSLFIAGIKKTNP
ncbi:MAG: PD40 domain-containing protein [Bacteroidales bacterium]|nr:PD40 domain-containing protein [Bacteroidales bacterium]